MNDATARGWKAAESAKAGALYTSLSRNPDKAVRDQFTGTRAWAVCKCMGLATASFSEDEASAITKALEA